MRILKWLRQMAAMVIGLTATLLLLVAIPLAVLGFSLAAWVEGDAL